MNIITGYRGEPHITSDQDRDANQGSYGTGSYILDVGAKMAATIVSANEVRIADGALSHQGCIGNIDKGQYESCTIANGTQGMKRSDLIVCRYERDNETNIESLSLVVIEGTPDASSPADPTYNEGDIQAGDSPVDMPLYRVNINGVSVSSVTRLADYVRTQAEIDALLGDTNISSIGGGTVTGAINSLNTTLGKKSENVTPNTTYFTNAGTQCQKIGSLVVVNIKGSAAQAFSGSHVLLTLPSGYRPDDLKTVQIWYGANGFSLANILTTGEIQTVSAFPSVVSGNNIRGTAVFFV